MKHCWMELIGTFFLTVAVSFTGNPLAIGLMLMAMIYLGFSISGAHYNPAVSFALWLKGKMDTDEMVFYILSQIAGALLAGLLFFSVSGDVYSPIIAPGVPTGVAGVVEVLLTFVLISVILTGLHQKSKVEHFALMVGLALTAIAYVGGMFNPAIALGSMGANLIAQRTLGDVQDLLVYIIAPCIGAGLSVYLCNYMMSGRRSAK